LWERSCGGGKKRVRSLSSLPRASSLTNP
jgi:hypothetical protein